MAGLVKSLCIWLEPNYDVFLKKLKICFFKSKNPGHFLRFRDFGFSISGDFDGINEIHADFMNNPKSGPCEIFQSQHGKITYEHFITEVVLKNSIYEMVIITFFKKCDKV